MAFPSAKRNSMHTVRIRVTGSADDARSLMDQLQGLRGIEHVEEVADLMPHMDDEDSSSAGLASDSGPGIHSLEINAPNAASAERVREAAEAIAFDLDLMVEFIDEDEEG